MFYQLMQNQENLRENLERGQVEEGIIMMTRRGV